MSWELLKKYLSFTDEETYVLRHLSHLSKDHITYN